MDQTNMVVNELLDQRNRLWHMVTAEVSEENLAPIRHRIRALENEYERQMKKLTEIQGVASNPEIVERNIKGEIR